MSLPKEKQVEIVISHKRHIVELTNSILDIIHEAKEHKYSDVQKLQIKKLVNESISELSTIAGFCSNTERVWVLNMARLSSLSIINEMYFLLEDWCTLANSISVDFNKTPFRFFGADLRLKWNQFEARVRGTADKRERGYDQ
jgi:hypothetical protein